MGKSDIVPVEAIGQRILVIRGHKLILDSDLARIYGVTTTRLNEQVERNLQRFPEDFTFQLTRDEFQNLMSHFAISSSHHGGRRKLPFVFTAYGAIIAANGLKSERAVRMSPALRDCPCVRETARDTCDAQGACTEALGVGTKGWTA